MNFFEMAEVYAFNNARRERLLNKAKAQGSKLEQIRFVVDYFLNNLPVSEILEIDCVDPTYLKLFEYDYSFIDDSIPRKQTFEFYTPNKMAITLHQADNDKRNGKIAKIYPTIFALKKGTCKMFANEIKRFAMDFDIDCEIIEEPAYCYDGFCGTNIKNQPVEKNNLCLMHHYYNIIKIDGKEYKIDIANFLSALDYLKNNPETKPFSIEDFYFSPDLESNPFNEIKNFVCPVRAIVPD